MKNRLLSLKPVLKNFLYTYFNKLKIISTIIGCVVLLVIIVNLLGKNDYQASTDKLNAQNIEDSTIVKVNKSEGEQWYPFFIPDEKQFKMIDSSKSEDSSDYRDWDTAEDLRIWTIDINDDGVLDILAVSRWCGGGSGSAYMILGNKNGGTNIRYDLPDFRKNIVVLDSMYNGMRDMMFDDNKIVFRWNGSRYQAGKEIFDDFPNSKLTDAQKKAVRAFYDEHYPEESFPSDSWGPREQYMEYEFAGVVLLDFNDDGKKDLVFCNRLPGWSGSGGFSCRILLAEEKGYAKTGIYIAMIKGSLYVLDKKHNGLRTVMINGSPNALQFDGESNYVCVEPCKKSCDYDLSPERYIRM